MASQHDVVALVTMPLRSSVMPPMRIAAEKYGVPIFDPPDINSPEGIELLKKLDADLFFVCDYGKILSVEVLALAKHGGINLHGSLLPKYRGAAPVNWAIFNGDARTGVSLIHMIARVDAGPIISQSPPIPIRPKDTAIDVENRLAEVGSWLVARVIKQIEENDVHLVPQLLHLVSFAPKLKKESGLIPWGRTANQIIDHFRAMQPWPRSFTFWKRKNMRLLLGPFEREHTQRASLNRSPDRKRRLQENYDFEQACELLIHITNIQDIADEMISHGLLSEDELISRPIVERRAGGRTQEPEINDGERPKPGTVLEASGNRLVVATGTEPVRVLQVQPAGKNLMDVAAFLRGYPVAVGDVFGN